MPRNVILAVVAACLLLGLGGVVAEHFVGAASLPGPSPGVATSLPPPPATTPDPGLSNSVSAMMDLRQASGAAPALLLASTSGRTVSLASLKGKVVVLWFYDAACDDICPVVERELRQSIADLGAGARQATFLAVNTDPFATAVTAAAPALARLHGLGWPRFAFLTGPLRVLNRVWSAYGITVDAQMTSHLVSHTELVAFVNERGDLAALATPSANQVGRRRYELAGSAVRGFATGVAAEVRHLESAPRASGARA